MSLCDSASALHLNPFSFIGATAAGAVFLVRLPPVFLAKLDSQEKPRRIFFFFFEPALIFDAKENPLIVLQRLI